MLTARGMSSTWRVNLISPAGSPPFGGVGLPEAGAVPRNGSRGTVPIFAADKVFLLDNALFAAKMDQCPAGP